jgi:hypothetical protein
MFGKFTFKTILYILFYFKPPKHCLINIGLSLTHVAELLGVRPKLKNMTQQHKQRD